MANNSIQVFQSPQFGQVRTAGTSDNPLFCLADICRALDLGNPSQVKTRLNSKGVQLVDLQTLTTNEGVSINHLQNQANFITEANLYKCIFQSRKPEAEAFQDWVCEEVLPSIRKTGGYGMYQVPQTFAEALMLAAQQQQQLEVAQAEQVRLQIEVQRKDTIIQEQAADVAFAQTIKASDTNIKLGDFAKVLASNGYIIGPDRLFKWLRENGFIFGDKNRPVQRYIDMGLFTFHEGPVRNAYHRDGSPVIGLTPYITPKGQCYIIERLNDGRLYMERKIQKPQPQQLSINY